MKIYVYGEQCQVMRGRVWVGNDDDEPEKNGDLFLWGEGTEEELIERARADETDPRSPDFDWKCARRVLEHLGADDDDCEEEDED